MKRLMVIILAVVMAISLLPVFAVPALAVPPVSAEYVLVKFTFDKDGLVVDYSAVENYGVEITFPEGIYPKKPTTFHWETYIYGITNIYVEFNGGIDEPLQVVTIPPFVTSDDVDVVRTIKAVTFCYLPDPDEDGGITPLPEIATIAMFGIGLVSLGGFVWFRRRRKAAEITG